MFNTIIYLVADFGTNLPPKELFDEGVNIEIEWDSTGKKVLSTEIENHGTLFKYEGKEDRLEKYVNASKRNY